MDNFHILNARIDNARLGYQRDVTFLGFYISLSYGGSGQDFTGWAFDEYDKDAKERVVTGPEFGLMVQNILRAMDVDWWDQLEGKICRVKRTGKENDFSGTVFAIGHPLKNQWFDVRDIGLEIW